MIFFLENKNFMVTSPTDQIYSELFMISMKTTTYDDCMTASSYMIVWYLVNLLNVKDYLYPK